MRFLTAIIDALVGFVQRNPLTMLIIVILALAAPAVLKGIAIFILYFIVGLVVLGVALLLLLRWRIRTMQKQMGEQFGRANPGAGGFGSPFAGAQAKPDDQVGDVKIYKTAETPEKRVSGKVGDYVDFEETKD